MAFEGIIEWPPNRLLCAAHEPAIEMPVAEGGRTPIS